MGRFKAGDRVKILAGHPYVSVGTEGVYVGREIRGYRGKHNVRVTYENGDTSELAFKGRELELLDTPAAQEPAEAWVPKVGDRVRADTCVHIVGGKSGSIVKFDGEFALVDFPGWTGGHRGQGVGGKDQEGGSQWFVMAKYLLPIQSAKQPARLTIEAGKFYRTRDGRKVGPMVPTKVKWTDRSGLASAFDKEDGEQYSADGFWLAGGRHSKDDLVAEWVDEPVVAAVPEATTGEVAPAKFTGKGAPGDVVRCDAWDGTLFKAGREYKFDANGNVTDEHGDAHDIIYAGSWTFLRNEPAAPPAKFKVGDRVSPKADQLRKVVGHWEEHWQRSQGRAHADVFYVVSEETGFFGLRISAKPDGNGPYWPAEFFELADAAPTQVGAAGPSFIVARLTAKGEPRPNARPRVHTTLASAETEAQRLADRLGDEFAIYQRVSTKTVDAGPVPDGFLPDLAKGWLSSGDGNHEVGGRYAGLAFSWGKAPQGFWFWGNQRKSLTPLGRAILRKWIAEAEAEQPKAAA